MHELTLNSLEVSKMMQKAHKNLMRDIGTYSDYLVEPIELNFELNEFWKESTYKDSIGRTLKCYQITKKGCEFLAHKMTGKKGALFTAAYINRFHEMEERLQCKSVSPIIRKMTYLGKPVMTAYGFASITGVSVSNILYQMRRFQLTTILTGEDLRIYKRENSQQGSMASSLGVMYYDAVVILAKKVCVWDKYKKQINNYFEVGENNVSAVPCSIRTPLVLKAVDSIQEKAITVKSLSSGLILSKRNKNKHIEYIDVLCEVAMSLLSTCQELKSRVSAN